MKLKRRLKKIQEWVKSRKDYTLKRMRMKISSLWDRKLGPPTSGESSKINAFREVARNFQTPEDHSLATDADRMWNRFKREMREYILEKDPRTFLRCRSIIKSISVPDSPYGYKELKYLKSRQDWKTRWKGAIEEDQWGHPYPYWCYPRSSGTRIHHAYHLALFEEKTGRRFSEHKTIVEFGGGYGNMPRLMSKLGYQDRYLIFDFPEFSQLQNFYLNGVGLNHGDLTQWNQGRCQQLSVTSWSDLSEALKNIDLNQTLFMATWSLSEAPFEIREPMLSRIKGVKSLLIAYQSFFEDLANQEYFCNFQKENPEYQWYNLPIDHIPGHYYLFGVRKLVES